MQTKYFTNIILAITVALSMYLGVALITRVEGQSGTYNSNKDAAVNVGNRTPVLNSHQLADSTGNISDGATVNPLVGPSTTPIYISGTVTDENGVTPTVRAAYYRSGYGGACTSSTEALPDCYRDTCTVTSTGDPTIFDYSCTYEAPYYADTTTTWTIGPNSSPTLTYESENWIVEVQVTDGTGSPTITDSTNNFEMGSVIGVDHPTDFSVGQAKLGTETTAVTTTVTNYGNQRTDISFYEDALTDFTCEGGETIPKEALRWYTSDAIYTSMIPIAESAAGYVDWDHDKATSSTLSTQDAYWKFKYDQPVGAGNCELNMTVYAVADVE